MPWCRPLRDLLQPFSQCLHLSVGTVPLVFSLHATRKSTLEARKQRATNPAAKLHLPHDSGPLLPKAIIRTRNRCAQSGDTKETRTRGQGRCVWTRAAQNRCRESRRAHAFNSDKVNSTTRQDVVNVSAASPT
ncbi:hypothetical protein BKA66DRAFT_443594 [Pyrenochaeta sp. MPI-SDFR-AT-0127]|nr:hypothetical protein BKA66DRAFT_443594 [Pyrenochaeta sp. MPI-SDFR-AT-0127]